MMGSQAEMKKVVLTKRMMRPIFTRPLWNTLIHMAYSYLRNRYDALEAVQEGDDVQSMGQAFNAKRREGIQSLDHPSLQE